MSSSPAPAPATAPTPAPVLCQGNQIEYKAFARHYAAGQQVATLVLLATCNFNSSGYSIAFQPTATGFQLMEQPPGGIVHFIVSYCSTSWTSFLEQVPSHVTVVDAAGEHKVHVKPW